MIKKTINPLSNYPRLPSQNKSKTQTEESQQIHFLLPRIELIYSHEAKINNKIVVNEEERIQVEREESIKTKLHNFHRKKNDTQNTAQQEKVYTKPTFLFFIHSF